MGCSFFLVEKLGQVLLNIIPGVITHHCLQGKGEMGWSHNKSDEFLRRRGRHRQSYKLNWSNTSIQKDLSLEEREELIRPSHSTFLSDVGQ
jgi:hypothetical protein